MIKIALLNLEPYFDLYSQILSLSCKMYKYAKAGLKNLIKYT